MSKIVISSLIVCLQLITQNIMVINKDASKVNETFHSIAMQMTTWQNSSYELKTIFLLNNKNYETYVVHNELDNNGYFILKNGKLISFYVGNFDIENLNNIESLSPIFNSKNNYETNINYEQLVSAVSVSCSPPTLITDNYQYTSISNYRAQIINNCPYYYNYPYGPVNMGCVPTSAAMLISFYDRYTNLTNLINGVLPLNHEDNKTLIDNFINLLAILMDTSTLTGTTLVDEKTGLNTYFNSMGYGQYKACQNYSFSEYENFIRNYHQPTLLGITTEYGNGHAVLGVGSAQIQNTGNFMITHYDDYESCSGDYYVAEDYFLDSVYMSI